MDQPLTRRESIGRPRAAMLSTNAETRVAPGWLAARLQELATGCDAVGGGTVTDDSVRPSPAGLRIQHFDTAHALLRRGWPACSIRSPSIPGPAITSLAATAHANRLAGGAPDVPDLEDEALVRALEHADLRVRHSPHVRELTSSRLGGGAAVPSGFRKERPIAGA